MTTEHDPAAVRAVHCPQCLASCGWFCRDAGSGFWLRVDWVHPARADLYARCLAQGLIR